MTAAAGQTREEWNCWGGRNKDETSGEREKKREKGLDISQIKDIHQNLTSPSECAPQHLTTTPPDARQVEKLRGDCPFKGKEKRQRKAKRGGRRIAPHCLMK